MVGQDSGTVALTGDINVVVHESGEAPPPSTTTTTTTDAGVSPGTTDPSVSFPTGSTLPEGEKYDAIPTSFVHGDGIVLKPPNGYGDYMTGPVGGWA